MGALKLFADELALMVGRIALIAGALVAALYGIYVVTLAIDDWREGRQRRLRNGGS